MGMSTGSRLVGLGLLLAGFYLAVLVFGPLAFLLIPVGLIIAGGVVMLRSEETTPPDRSNCPACGAPNDPDADTCRHCGATMDGPARAA